MRLNEINFKNNVAKAIQEHIEQSVPFTECMFRPGSHAFTEFYREVKRLYNEGKIEVDWQDAELLETDIGECVVVEGERVALDVPAEIAEEAVSEAEYRGKKVELNKPKRGGSKKFYVYVKNPKTGNIKKVSFGAKGMSVKTDDPERVRNFVARHDCKNRNDKTTASYWSCRLPRYKSLGIKGGQWW